MRKIISIAAAIVAIAGSAYAQTITTQNEYMASDTAELKALSQEANGDVYSLPHDKKIRVASIMLKYFIRETFIDPDSVQAMITNDPHHADVTVWQGLLNGGNKTYSGMVVCARINGKNRMGGYAGNTDYLVIFTTNGGYRSFQSPYYNQFTKEMETDRTVTSTCAN